METRMQLKLLYSLLSDKRSSERRDTFGEGPRLVLWRVKGA